MTCLAIDQYQPGIFYLQNYELQRNTHFFLGLECFYRHPNSKMSNHKLKYISFLLLGILDCDAKMRYETAGYYCIIAINFGIQLYRVAVAFLKQQLCTVDH